MPTSDAAAAAAYKKVKLTEQLREELLGAFRKHKALRAKRVDLEQQLERVVAKLKEQDQVGEILDKPEYQDIEVRHHREWLHDIEEDVASTYKTAKRKQATTLAKNNGTATERKRESTPAKMMRLIEVLRASDKKTFTLPELAEKLELKSAQTGAWLKPLNLGPRCIVWIEKGNRKKGKQINVEEVMKELKKADLVS
jgi:hypothetical protein